MNKFLKILLEEPVTVAEKFHAETKLNELPTDKDPKFWPSEWKTTFFKEYPRLDRIFFPSPGRLGSVTLENVLRERKSTRLFSSKVLSLEKIGQLLFYSAGLRDNEPPWIGNRTYPSAGARYPLEVYLISQKSDLPSGAYHYNLKTHSLEVLIQDKLNSVNFFSSQWKKAPMFIIITAIFRRNMIKYGVRGYRHILVEAGHLSQNFYLTATALNIGISSLGGYLDNEVNEMLDIDGIHESVICTLALGEKIGK